MKVIADCGGTKSSWAVIGDGGNVRYYETTGINVLQLSEEEILEIVSLELAPVLGDCEKVTEVWYYGAGTVDERACRAVADALKAIFAHAEVAVSSDLVGAARALCGHDEGIACILGTGSNSCLYDGREIVANVSPLGYILGDEGSGAVLGRMLLSDVLKRQLPDEICRAFYDEYHLDAPAVTRRVYREPGAQAWLASFVPFIKKYIAEPAVRLMVVAAFEAFFRRNVCLYPRHKELPVNFAGSIATHFADELTEAARNSGCKIGRVVQRPIEALVNYHA